MFRKRHSATSKNAQECCLLDIIASGSIDASNGVAKATATKHYSNGYRWCTFIKHSRITDKLLGEIPQEQKKII